jgi:toxin FitB
MLLEPNVVPEVGCPTPNPPVMDWLDTGSAESHGLCTPVVAELRFGIERLPEGFRKRRLSVAAGRLFSGYRGRILSFDIVAAAFYARISTSRERAGRGLEAIEAMIASIARANGMTRVTRNTADFTGIGLDLIDPFTAPSP